MKREHWKSKFGAIMALASSAVGLGSLWLVPVAIKGQGGGNVVFAFIFFTLLIALPAFIAETIFGRDTQRSAIKAFMLRTPPNRRYLRYIGVIPFILAFIITLFYSVVSGYYVLYTVLSLCGVTELKSIAELNNLWIKISETGYIGAGCCIFTLAMSGAVTYFGVREGIEKWSSKLMPMLFVILLVLFGMVCTLPKFCAGAAFVLIPNFATLSFQTLLVALDIAIICASVGLGILISYGSYMNTTDNIPKSSGYTVIISMLVTLFSALIILPASLQADIHALEGSGVGFTINTLVSIFKQMPFPRITSTAFFSLGIIAAITSLISVLEVIVSNVADIFGTARHRTVVAITLLFIVLTLPVSFHRHPFMLDLIGDDLIAVLQRVITPIIPISISLSSIFIGWLTPGAIAQQEFLAGNRYHTLLGWWLFTIRWVVPMVSIILLLGTFY